MAHALRILHLSTVDIEGGAARSAYRLHVGLRQLGYESLMLVAEKKSYDPSVIAFAPPTGILNRLTRRLRHDRITRSFSRYHLSRPEGYERFSDDRSLYGGNLASSLPPCDVIHLRSVSSFVGSEVFHRLPGQTPLVWTLDDMNPLTGGCRLTTNAEGSPMDAAPARSWAQRSRKTSRIRYGIVNFVFLAA